MAGALEIQAEAVDKLRIRSAGARTQHRCHRRQQAIESYVSEFESMMQQSCSNWVMHPARCGRLVGPVDRLPPDQRARRGCTKASGEASDERRERRLGLEELSASINDISQQARMPPGLPAARFNQAGRPTAPSGLAKSAAGSAKVVGLINSIAAQTTSWR